MEYDVFIPHASEDERDFVAPLALRLSGMGLAVWYDEFSLTVGDSIVRSIDKGLATSRYGVIVLSQAFMSKPWPEYELRGLASKEIGRDKVVLPIWHGVSREDVLRFSPPLADKLALDTSRQDLGTIVLKLVEVVKPEVHRHLIRLRALDRVKSDAEAVRIPLDSIKVEDKPPERLAT